MKNGIYSANGIILSKDEPKEGDQLEISYHGLLAASGAKKVIVHTGYDVTWENPAYIDMQSDGGVFKVSIALERPGVLNFAFTDPLGNWDNNSGDNYSVSIAQKKRGAAKQAKAVKDEETKEVKAEETVELVDKKKKTASKIKAEENEKAETKKIKPVEAAPTERAKPSTGKKKSAVMESKLEAAPASDTISGSSVETPAKKVRGKLAKGVAEKIETPKPKKSRAKKASEN